MSDKNTLKRKNDEPMKEPNKKRRKMAIRAYRVTYGSRVDKIYSQLPRKKKSVEKETFFNQEHLEQMKARARAIIKENKISRKPDPAYSVTNVEWVKDMEYFKDDALNKLISTILLSTVSIDRLIKYTANIFWSKDEIEESFIPPTPKLFKSINIRPIYGYEWFYEFWSQVNLFLCCKNEQKKYIEAVERFNLKKSNKMTMKANESDVKRKDLLELDYD